MNPYRLLYRLGITPWEREQVPTRVVEFAASYDAPSRALDVGCGTGRDAVYLAAHGWSVTGVDAVPQAMDAARRRAQAAGVRVNWILGDVTRLRDVLPAEPFTLVLDRGCFHGLADDERERCAEGLTAATAPGARLLMFAFQPRTWGLGPRGITRDHLEHDFRSGWQLTAGDPDRESRIARWIGDAKPTWYQLERRA